jgi:uncharacterized protein
MDLSRLQNPELMLGSLTDLVVLDEIQRMPELFKVLRVLVDRPNSSVRFLILGSASPDVVRNASESLAGRVEFIELGGFDLTETGPDDVEQLFLRGGFPPSFLALSESDSAAWREGFIRTFLERDIPQLGITIPAATMRRFWTMLAHLHGTAWNASKLAGAMGLSDKTVRGYLDLLTGTFMVRQLQPWMENVGKRQVKAPKIYLRDSGLLHALLGIGSRNDLAAHPAVGLSWEGFVIEQIARILSPPEMYFWGTHSGTELDLFLLREGRRLGIEVKFSEAPRVTRSMRSAIDTLRLDHLWIVYPGHQRFLVDAGVTVLPLREITPETFSAGGRR